MKDICKNFKKAVNKNYGIYSEEYAENKVKELYEELTENLSESDLTRVNNIFCILGGISLDTLINSEDDTLADGFYELQTSIEE